MGFARILVVSLLAVASAGALAVDARDRGFLSKGMPEGEVLFRIGKPDHEAFVRNVKGEPEEKTWTYFPHPRDPQTLTIVTLRAGIVAGIERKIAR
ncbi:MAG: hypothetical protein JNM26_06640 [Ideonella sp.]|nr:hypothetical protein [Ideonella sp.]